MPNIEEKFVLLEHDLNSKLTDIDIKIEHIRNSLLNKLDDKVPFKLFLLLITLIMGNIGFQWAVYEKAKSIEFKTEKSLVEFKIRIENAQGKIEELRRAIRQRD